VASAHSQPLGHWSTLVEGLQASPQECYAAIEAALQRRQIPGAVFSRVTYKEGGFGSADRIYLRVSRKMLAFDICAAPFGTGFFFSWWQRKLPPSNALGCLVTFLAMAAAGWFLRTAMRMREAAAVPLSFTQTVVVGLLLLLFVLWALGAAVRSGFLFSEDAILDTPILGALYNAIFRPETYYKLDTIDMYQKAVHAAVLEVVDGVMSAKGLRALGPEERLPTLGKALRP
jgi:hypothetical protein